MTASPAKPAGSLREQAVEGTLWSAIAQVGVQLTGLLSTAILARLLLPKEFGVVGMAMIFIGLGEQLNELGLSSAIVQRKDLHPEHMSTSFWSTVGMAVALALALVATAPWVALFFKEPRVVGVLRLISLDFVLASLAMVPRSLLQRHLRFRGIALSQLAGGIAYGVVAIVAALLGAGVYSLVVGQLAFTFACNMVVWKVCGWNPRFEFSRRRFGELSSYSFNMLGANMLSYAGANVDKFLVGRLLGPASLGVYSMAYNLATTPQRKISRLFLSVLFPAFSRIQDEGARLREAFLRSQKLLAVLICPMLVGLAFVASDFVTVVLGGKWGDAVWPIRILCLAGLLGAIASPVSGLIQSRGRPDILVWFGLARLVSIGLFVWIGVRWGAVGVAWGVTVYTCLYWGVYLYIATRLVDAGMRDYLLKLLPGIVSSLAMIAVLALVWFPTRHLVPMAAVRLVILVTAGVGAYALCLRLAFRETWGESWEIGRSLLDRLRSPFRRAAPAAPPS